MSKGVKEICDFLECLCCYTITENINIWFIMKKI